MTGRERPRVVVADDNFVVARCVSFMLKKEGFDCRAVADGEAALVLLREERADLLILDLDMPRKNGFEVCRELRADPDLRAVHVLVLTGKGQPASGDWHARIPADGFMLKPFDPPALLRYVREHFGQAGTAGARRDDLVGASR